MMRGSALCSFLTRQGCEGSIFVSIAQVFDDDREPRMAQIANYFILILSCVCVCLYCANDNVYYLLLIFF